MQRGVRLVQALLLAVPSRGQRVDIAAGRLLAWPQQRLPSLTGLAGCLLARAIITASRERVHTL